MAMALTRDTARENVRLCRIRVVEPFKVAMALTRDTAREKRVTMHS